MYARALVGEVAPAAVLPLIEANFASLHGIGPAIAPVAPTPPPADGLRAHVITNPLATAAVASLVAIVPLPPDTACGTAQEFGLNLYARIDHD